MRPDLITADPAEVSPGETVGLSFPEETLRGVGFSLDERVGGTWALRYYLSSDPALVYERTPKWWPAGGRPTLPDIGIGGPGPDVVVVPPPTIPGNYRICANGADEFCTPLRVTSSGR